MVDRKIPGSMQGLIADVKKQFPDDAKIGQMFEQCFTNTYKTTMKPQEDGTVFIITGDIPAMWLRDSALQVRPYLLLAENDPVMADMIEGVVRRQFRYIQHDPYANAFNESENGNRYHDDDTKMTPLIWERKFELDSLCFPIQLAYLFWKTTGRITHFDETFHEAVLKITDLMAVEQNHEALSPYRFQRHGGPESETLERGGKGNRVVPNGMIWSGFRPSDDACKYGYLVPANMFAVVVMRCLREIACEVLGDEELAKTADRLAADIEHGLRKHAVVNDAEFGEVFAYETDGMGHFHLMDDANVPSLLSLPYIGYCALDDPIYENTRRLVLSKRNPYYYQGTAAKGIGSPHTPPGYVWHISLAIQGMTSTDPTEKEKLLAAFKTTDAGTGYMHEGFNVNNPGEFTRSWFAWANSMFSEFVLGLCGRYVKGSALEKACGFSDEPLGGRETSWNR